MRPEPGTSLVGLSSQGRGQGEAPSTELAVRRPTSVLTRNAGLVARRALSADASVTEIRRLADSAYDPTTAIAPPVKCVDNRDAQHEVLKLVQSLFLPLGSSTDGLRSVMFAAPESSQHSETTSALTAETLAAHTGRTVCLVDANVRAPFLHRHFRVGNSIGFSDVLSGTRAATSVAVPVASKLWLVPAGLRRPRQAPVQDGLSRAVADLLSTFDFVLFGACSLGSQPDAIQLALLVDGVVLVVDHERTRRDAARRSVDVLQAAQARVLGVVLRSRGPSGTGPWRRR
ncbi:MAG: hypothetical protein ABMA15_00775 [Vicinamibacterales bacterium]